MANSEIKCSPQWKDVTSQCTAGQYTSDLKVYENEELKLYSITGVCGVGAPNQTILVSLPKSSLYEKQLLDRSVIDISNGMSSDILYLGGVIRSSHSLNNPTPRSFMFGGICVHQ